MLEWTPIKDANFMLYTNLQLQVAFVINIIIHKSTTEIHQFKSNKFNCIIIGKLFKLMKI